MSLRTLFATTLLCASILPFQATAAEPIVALMPIVKELRAELNLNADQNASLDAWLAEAPAKRKSLEGEVAALRSELRDAILDGSTRMQRDDLKARLAAKETRLIEMRSLCTRFLRNTLDKDDFDRVVATYRARN
ncbi:MAG: hypothetical protein ACPGU7_01245 [Gammaproteobacteria bacterium]